MIRKFVQRFADRALIRINARLDRQYKTAVQDLAVAGGKLTACRQQRDRAMAELADALVHVGELTVHIGELTASKGEIALAAVVEHEQTVAEHRRGADPLLVSQDKPRPGVAQYPHWRDR